MTLRVALLGAGAMGTIMAREIYPRLVGTAEVVAVVDGDPERAAGLAAALGARPHTSLAVAVAEELDAVDVRLPHAAHTAAALEALHLGLHVLVEKPLALSVVDCRRLDAAAAAAGRVIAVAENYPHLGAVRAARAAIDRGAVGELLALRTTRAYTLDGVWAQAVWRRGTGEMAGLLWDQGTHHTSLLRALGGEIVAVTAQASAGRRTPGAEVACLGVEFASGLAGQSLYCWGAPARRVETEALVLGSAGQIDVTVSYNSAEGRAELGSTALSAPEGYYDSHRAIVADFAAAVVERRPPRVTVASATEDVRVVLAARASLERGGAVVRTDEVG